MLALLSSAALADDFVGQASVIDGDTLEIHGTRIRLWGIDAPESSQLCRGEDGLQYSCGAQAANDLDASLRGVLSTVTQSTSTNMAARSQPVPSVVRTSANGLCLAASLWIGPNTRKADMPGCRAKPSGPAVDSGRAAMSSPGSTVLASARAGSRPPARMTQTRPPD